MNALKHTMHVLLFFPSKSKSGGQRSKDYIGFYLLVCRKKKAPVFIWPYIDLVSHIEVQNLSSLIFPPKEVFFLAILFSQQRFLSKEKKKTPWWSQRMIEDEFSFFCGRKIIYLQNNWEVQSKGKFVLDRRENYPKLVQQRIILKEKKKSRNS